MKDKEDKANPDASMTPAIKDERDGKPSASSMERISLCPGSHSLSAGIKEKESSDATRGSRIHAIIAGEKVGNPTAEEMGAAERCDELSGNVIESTFGIPIGDCDVVTREERLWSIDSRFSGKPDLVVIHGKEALIIDYKTGAGEVTHIDENVQLRTLAVLVRQNCGRVIEHVTVCTIQPLAYPSVRVCRYNKNALDMAWIEIRIIVDAAGRLAAGRYAGLKQCKYCPAKTRCPEAYNALMTLAKSMEVRTAAQLTKEQLVDALNRCEQVESIIDAIREEAKQRIDLGEEVSGWSLKPGAERETVEQTAEVFSRYMLAGGSQESFLSAASISKTNLKDMIKSISGSKGKHLDEEVRVMLSGCTKKTVASPKLVREKLINK